MIRLLTLCVFLTTGFGTAAETLSIKRTHRPWEQEKFDPVATLRPVLHLPRGDGPFALVIIVNSSGGAKDVFLRRFPKALVEAGIAAVALDTFTPRGIVTTTLDQSQISAFTMALDALAVARHFARDARIDGKRIAVAGHSKGGTVVAHLANARFYQRFGAKPRFEAGVAFSPSCFAQFAQPVSAFPLYGLAGAKDDVTPPRFCLPLFERLHRNPHIARFEIVPGTYHSWSLDGPDVRHVDWLPNVMRGPCAKDAPFYYAGPRQLRSSRTQEVLSVTEYRKRCAGGFGKTFGGGREMLPLAFEKAIDFLRSALALQPR